MADIPLTMADREEIVSTLQREIDRLTVLTNDYHSSKPRTQNVALRTMAEEGALNMQDRIKRLRALKIKVSGGEHEQTQSTRSTGQGAQRAG